MSNQKHNRNPLADRQRMRELAERNLDLGRVDESARDISEMLLKVAPKGLQDGYYFNLAFDTAAHLYTFTSHFQDSLKDFLGVSEADLTNVEESIPMVSKQSS
jgi:hypothetical protein